MRWMTWHAVCGMPDPATPSHQSSRHTILVAEDDVLALKPGPKGGFGLARWPRQAHPNGPVLFNPGYNSTRRVPRDIAREARLIE